MKSAITLSFLVATMLFVPFAAHACEGFGKTPRGHQVAYSSTAYAKATALHAPSTTDGPVGIMHSGDAGFSWEPSNW
jgi:hypothetical protein